MERMERDFALEAWLDEQNINIYIYDEMSADRDRRIADEQDAAMDAGEFEIDPDFDRFGHDPFSV